MNTNLMHLADVYEEARMELILSPARDASGIERAFRRWLRSRRLLYDFVAANGPQVVCSIRYWAEDGRLCQADEEMEGLSPEAIEALMN